MVPVISVMTMLMLALLESVTVVKLMAHPVCCEKLRCTISLHVKARNSSQSLIQPTCNRITNASQQSKIVVFHDNVKHLAQRIDSEQLN